MEKWCSSGGVNGGLSLKTVVVMEEIEFGSGRGRRWVWILGEGDGGLWWKREKKVESGEWVDGGLVVDRCMLII